MRAPTFSFHLFVAQTRLRRVMVAFAGEFVWRSLWLERVLNCFQA